MDTELIKIINKVINDKYTKTKHKTYYSNEYYLTNIFEMLNDINKWVTLKKLKSYNPVIINNKQAPTHYSTIRKKFNKWCNDDIFELAFNKCINLTKINTNVKLSIDASFINNKYGIEDIALNIDNKKKRAYKISLISDTDKFIYSILSIKINIPKIIKVDKRKKQNKIKKDKLKKRLAFIHDVNTIQDSLNKINSVYNFSDLTLLGDKGYISKHEYNNKKINLLTYKKNNQTPNTNDEIITLKERIYSENAIAKIKKNERVMTRKDHKIKSYMGFVFMASLINNLKVTKKLNKTNNKIHK
jgi:hypothetical protein